MNLSTAVIYGVIQGLAEFLPVSSSGHLALLPKLMQIEDPGVFFDLMMHVGTAGAIIVYFHRRIIGLLKVIPQSLNLSKSVSDEALLVRHFIISTLASVALILVLKDFAKELGRTSLFIGINLIVFGLVMYIVDRFAKKSTELGLMQSQWKPWQALFIGLAQSLAIFPGVSRSGVTLTAARVSGLSRLESSAYSFLLSLPIILAGALAEIPKAINSTPTVEEYIPMLVGVVVSFFVGLATIHFFLKIISKWSLLPFFIYRLLLGLAVIFY